MATTALLKAELRESARVLWQRSGYSASCIATLGVAIGITTVLFSVLYGILLRALPYDEPNRLFAAHIMETSRLDGATQLALVDSRVVSDWIANLRSAEAVGAYRQVDVALATSVGAEHVIAVRTTPQVFAALRRAPALGRIFDEKNAALDIQNAAVLSSGLWRRRFGASPNAVGQAVSIDGQVHRVIGVMPDDFYFPDAGPELWLHLDLASASAQSERTAATQYFSVVLRLKTGAEWRYAEQEAEGVRSRSVVALEGRTDSIDRRVALRPLLDDIVHEVRYATVALFVGASLVLLAASWSVGGQLLARGLERRHEFSVRLAVGATPTAPLRLQAIETGILALLAAMLGLVLAILGHFVLPALLPQDVPRVGSIRLDLRAFSFAFLVAALAALVANAAPALAIMGGAGVGRARLGNRAGTQRRLLRGGVLALQVAVGTVLFAGSLASVHHYWTLATRGVGVAPQGTAVGTVHLTGPTYDTDGLSTGFFDDVLEDLTADPRLAASALVSFPPLSPTFAMTSFGVEGAPAERRLAVPQLTSPGYPDAIGARLRSGRWLSSEEHLARIPVAVINEELQRRYFAGSGALGRYIVAGGFPLEIVGVLENTRIRGPGQEPLPEFYFSYRLAQRVLGAEPSRLTLLARARGNPNDAALALPRVVRTRDPEVAVAHHGLLINKLSMHLARPRLYAVLLAAFATLTLLIAVLGVHGTFALDAQFERRENAIRFALGASPSSVAWRYLKRAVLLAALGIAVAGGILATAMPLARAYFSETKQALALALGVASVVFLVCTLGAAARPALLAARGATGGLREADWRESIG